jgi:hypothetical protein
MLKNEGVRSASLIRLEALLLEGLNSPEIPLTPEFWKGLITEASEIAEKRNAQKRP